MVCICLKVIIHKNTRKLGQDFHSFATCDLALYAVLCMQYEFSLNENFIILSPITLGGTRNETEEGFSSGSVRGVGCVRIRRVRRQQLQLHDIYREHRSF